LLGGEREGSREGNQPLRKALAKRSRTKTKRGEEKRENLRKKGARGFESTYKRLSHSIAAAKKETRGHKAIGGGKQDSCRGKAGQTTK